MAKVGSAHIGFGKRVEEGENIFFISKGTTSIKTEFSLESINECPLIAKAVEYVISLTKYFGFSRTIFDRTTTVDEQYGICGGEEEDEEESENDDDDAEEEDYESELWSEGEDDKEEDKIEQNEYITTRQEFQEKKLVYMDASTQTTNYLARIQY
ncbi:unnamed protein product [Didymodactylos carnosus]|uniref:Uncharacterized protein n=1 Tax=Didymodactylos carnosus TaxID=1234261 RepID=A0A8S2IDR5_9BILA|nr:unnamed protein product [Didymodactylos carnosus]CAF3716971.1 unnamed protein product [Didymodactylos carnosus]